MLIVIQLFEAATGFINCNVLVYIILIINYVIDNLDNLYSLYVPVIIAHHHNVINVVQFCQKLVIALFYPKFCINSKQYKQTNKSPKTDELPIKPPNVNQQSNFTIVLCLAHIRDSYTSTKHTWNTFYTKYQYINVHPNTQTTEIELIDQKIHFTYQFK